MVQVNIGLVRVDVRPIDGFVYSLIKSRALPDSRGGRSTPTGFLMLGMFLAYWFSVLIHPLISILVIIPILFVVGVGV